MKNTLNTTACLLLLLMFGLSGCRPESDFDRWLTKKEGNWNVFAASYRYVDYNSETDSTISDAFNVKDIGTMRFFDPMQCEIDFELAGIDWSGIYDYAAGEDGFFIQKITPNIVFIGDDRLTITGYNNSKKTMRVELRKDSDPLQGGYTVIRASMDLERQ